MQEDQIKEIIQEELPLEVKEQQVEEKVELITDSMERLSALQEIEVLNKLINTVYYLPKFDNGNKGKQQPKITSSVPLNYFNNRDMEKWGTRILEISKKLGN